MRQRIARLGSSRPQTPVLDPLYSVIRANHPKADLAQIERAYRTAEKHHRGQTRRSGDAYITHPLAVTTILAELGMTEATLCAALLHDTIEDTSYTLQQLTRDFGEEIALLVDGCTKLDKVKYGESAKSETIRKMVIAMARDIRVLVIKLADRLHNMRTLHYLRPDKQSRIAQETLEIFAPLAHRLGMNAVKWELEDLSFATLHPKVYDEIVRLVAEAAPERDEFLSSVIDQVQGDLKAAKIKATVTGRPKHYYSIYQKMVVRGRDFADIFDLVGLRILVETPRDCYAALGVMHVRWNPLPGRFKDYIAMPKFNMYQSLHTTVLGPKTHPVELQIRTDEMHRRAEFGVAAHWKYKEGKGTPTVAKASDAGELVWVRQLWDWQRETADPSEFLDSLRFEINSTEVYAFTPRGDVISLPQGSTPVDFAYAIHTEVGNACVGARVNSRLVPLESELSNGDVVEIFTSKSEGAGPSRDWLSFVRSPRARNKIRHYFTRERREESIETGKEALARQMRKGGLPLQRLLTLEHLTAVAGFFKLPDVSSLYAAVGEGNVGAQAVINRLISVEGGDDATADETSEDRVVTGRRRRKSGPTDTGIEVVGASDLWVKLAKCCTPVPGDGILGFVTRGAGVSVHRTDCVNAANLRAEHERLVEVTWAPTSKSSFLVAIQVEALDRNRLLSDITRSLSDQHVNILSAALNTTKDRICKARFTFETADPTHLDHVLRAVRQVPAVFDVYRVSQ
jgi:GTP diphosphokinase / guanosine-3',5'-bis(diphosphate) 3'-diphosphatase